MAIVVMIDPNIFQAVVVVMGDPSLFQVLAGRNGRSEYITGFNDRNEI